MSSQRPHPRPDPLSDVVLRPTADGPVAGPQAWRAEPVAGRPVTVARSRTAILDGARRAVLADGTRITMSQIAARAGIAKATLYNHFRAREDVLAALLLAEIDVIISGLAHLELSEALRRAAGAVSEHPLLEALGGQDTLTLAVLARIDVRSAGWARVAEATEGLLNSAGRRGTPMVLRWLSSFVIAPAEAADIAADVEVLIAGLPPLRSR